MKKHKKRDLLFYVGWIIGGFFILSPLFLRCPVVENALLCFLRPLKESEYKICYIETFGAILGTFLAIYGTLWTQRKIGERTAKKELRENALIIYYDFDFALKDIIALMQTYFSSCSRYSDKLQDFQYFLACTQKYRMYLDSEWIRNVAKMSDVLSSKEMHEIYSLYGDLCTIGELFNSPQSEISEAEANRIYSLICTNFCFIDKQMNDKTQIVVSLQNEVLAVLKKLAEFGYVDGETIC